MSILSKIIENQQTLNVELKDASGSKFINNSGVYELTVEKAFAIQSSGGAIGITVSFIGDASYEHTFWITNKEGKTYYSMNGKDMALPGYIETKKLNYLLTENMLTSVADIKTENRIIKWYKYVDDVENEGKKKKVDANIEAEVLVDWIGKKAKFLFQMVQKEGWDKDTQKGSGIGAVTKDGEPITEPTIIDMFNLDNKTASESFANKESVAYAKGLERIEKTPIRFFKAKQESKPTSSSNSKVNTGTVPKPNIFG